MIKEVRIGIPTEYKGIWFRSLLEARWARFFDLIGWNWSYEPIELRGYIPDFILKFNRPLLIEVKPEFSIKDIEKHKDKIENSGWGEEALIIGVEPIIGENSFIKDCPAFGLLGERGFELDNGRDIFAWAEACWFQCNLCNKLSFCHSQQTFDCRVSGCYDGDHHIIYEDRYKIEKRVMKLWNQAKEDIKWKSKKINQ